MSKKHQPSDDESTSLGGLILCGGLSKRMGTPKAWLDFAGTPLLGRVSRTVLESSSPVVVVAAAGQPVPELDPAIEIIRDSTAQQGPLQGLADGLAALADRCDAAFVCGCDSPFISTELIGLLSGLLDDRDAVVPMVDGFPQPLLAIYRTTLTGKCQEHLAGESRSLRVMLADLDVRAVSLAELRRVDPELDVLRNINTPKNYEDILQRWQSLGNDPRS